VKTRKGLIGLKSTGIVLEIDDEGGVTIPHEVLEEVGVEYNDSLKMFPKGDNIYLSKEE
jgi:bifunctional DNA-binding transcriptional regulator/antitoxin component of YhaV-PrlF toxin-antitoxin module